MQIFIGYCYAKTTLKLGNTFYLNKILNKIFKQKHVFLTKITTWLFLWLFLDQKFWNGSAGGSGRHGVPGIVIVKQQLRLSRDSPWGRFGFSHESSEQSDCSRDSAGLQHQCQNWKLCLSFLSVYLQFDTVSPSLYSDYPLQLTHNSTHFKWTTVDMF